MLVFFSNLIFIFFLPCLIPDYSYSCFIGPVFFEDFFVIMN